MQIQEFFVVLVHFWSLASYLAQYFCCYSNRESLSPTQDLTETTGEESEDHPPHTDHGDSTHKSYLSPEFTRASPPSPSSKFEVNCSTQGRHDQASSSPANGLVSANLPKSQPQDLDIKDGAKTIRRALLRSRRASRPVIVDNGSFALTKQSEETQTEHQTQDGFRAFQNNTMEKEESPPNKDTILLGYDAQWCWVESQDDVTFLWSSLSTIYMYDLWFCQVIPLSSKLPVMRWDLKCTLALMNEWCLKMNVSLSVALTVSAFGKNVCHWSFFNYFIHLCILGRQIWRSSLKEYYLFVWEHWELEF